MAKTSITNMTLSAIFPNGSSRDEREQLMKSWFKKYGNPYIEGKEVWNDVIWRIDSELSAMSMLDSCFAYGGVDKFYTTKSCCPAHYHQTYYEEYLENFIKLGGTKREFDKAIAAQKKYYERCKVVYAGTDSEGVSYNAIVECE